jgi:mannose-6-phosphate isomerase-like protein (cupin superfamily)
MNADLSPAAGLHLCDLLEAPVRRISAADTNKFVLLADPVAHRTSFVQVIEIFDIGGRTPPNVHARADETFYVLAGHGEAQCGGHTVALRPGRWMLLKAGLPHVVVNTGPGRLYCLTTMVPDEDFAALVRSGVPDTLDEVDLTALGCLGP